MTRQLAWHSLLPRHYSSLLVTLFLPSLHLLTPQTFHLSPSIIFHFPFSFPDNFSRSSLTLSSLQYIFSFDFNFSLQLATFFINFSLDSFMFSLRVYRHLKFVYEYRYCIFFRVHLLHYTKYLPFVYSLFSIFVLFLTKFSFPSFPAPPVRFYLAKLGYAPFASSVSSHLLHLIYFLKYLYFFSSHPLVISLPSSP